MTRARMTEFRADFRGGRNTAVSPDMLNPTELVESTNTRLDVLGALMKRTGTKRMHTTAIGSGNPVRGLTQWDSPGGRQIVAISNGRLYHKLTDFGEFTEVIPAGGSEFSTTEPANFQPFRASSSGAPLVLFIASGGKYYKFDGTTLTRIDGTTDAPPCDVIRSYNTRMFAKNVNFKKHLFWSKVGNAEVFTTGTGTDGGSAMVDVLTGDEIVALEDIGSSLAIMTEDSIVRFQGLDTDTIVISQATAGISPEVGIVGKLAYVRVEQVLQVLSDRGPYYVAESGATAIGQDIEPDFADLDRANISKSVVGHHRQRRETWNAVPGASDGGLNKTVFVSNYRVQNWCGPFTYPFGITYFSRFEDSVGDEWIMAGCADGFVRHMDIGSLDDVLANGTGGSAYTMTVELAPIFFATGPGNVKALDRIDVQADLASSSVVLKHAFDTGGLVSETALVGVGTGVQDYRVDVSNQGKRLRIQLVDSSSDIPIINGLVISAFDFGERY